MSVKSNTELHFTKKDFKIEWYSGSGAGGQHRNKHQNCCRIIHIESGLKAQGTEARDRVTNQRNAFNRLAQLLINHYAPDAEKIRFGATKVIRNYNGARNEVLDKRSGFRQKYTDVVEKGNLAEMIEARKKVSLDPN